MGFKNKSIFRTINIEGFLMHIINWDNKYIIVADLKNKAFKIIDIEIGEVISIYKHNLGVVSIKKLFHPIYGESLLSAARDDKIRLWHI